MTPQHINKSDFVTTTVRLDRAVSDQLRRMSFDVRMSQNSLIAGAVLGLLYKQGYFPVVDESKED